MSYLTAENIDCILSIVKERTNCLADGNVWSYPEDFKDKVREWLKQGVHLRIISYKLQIQEPSVRSMLKINPTSESKLIEHLHSMHIKEFDSIEKVILVHNLYMRGLSLECISRTLAAPVEMIRKYINLVDVWLRLRKEDSVQLGSCAEEVLKAFGVDILNRVEDRLTSCFAVNILYNNLELSSCQIQDLTGIYQPLILCDVKEVNLHTSRLEILNNEA